jgi:hypothetical protein
VPVGTRISHPGENVTTAVRRTNRSAQMVHRERTKGSISEALGHSGLRTAIGAPVMVDGRLWGSRHRKLDERGAGGG